MQPAFEVREFRWEDYEGATSLWLEAFGSLKPEDTREKLAVTLERNPGLFLVADSEGRIVGTVIGAWDGRRGHLYHVAVARTHRRFGIARRLVREAASRIFALGSACVHLRVAGENTGAIAFYHRTGFTSDPPIIGMRIVRPAP